MPPLHDIIALPPPVEVATERSYEGDRITKLPPVVCESVTATLVAFTTSPSATELVAMVRVAADEDRVTDSEVKKLRAAARALRVAIPKTTIKQKMPHHVRYGFICWSRALGTPVRVGLYIGL
jgi:hypothetical protein